jgi:alkylation response protein AidB-like acyl-CoA dehydrogenase
MGGDYFALCVALEELARVDSSVANHAGWAGGLARRHADLPVRHRGGQKREWLPRLCAGAP